MVEQGFSMHKRIQGSPLRFRVNPALLARVQERASNEGVSVSEFVRTALRRELAQ